MIKSNSKRLLITATIALGAALASPRPAMAQYPEGAALYRYYYYNQDYSEIVGEAYDNCNAVAIGTSQIWGVQTGYVTLEVWAYCRNGQAENPHH